ncbi:MAG TPA: hypothetical protein VM165_10620 [Planctomycetaceae bacterium]|nr:hypothetical protein [Planctomycetaceae bacterium]
MSLREAVAELRNAVPSTLDVGDDTAWQRCLTELLSGHAGAVEAMRQVVHGDFESPIIVATQSLAQLLEALKPVPRGPQKAGVVKALAEWWQSEFGDEANPTWPRALEDYRTELRSIRGLGPETVDRLLLFGAGLAVAPVDRATLRIAVRHGWLDLPVTDEEAQATFLAGLGRSVDELRDGVRRLHDIGAEFCGRVPDCERCPLKPFLLAGGPLSPDAC